MDVPMLDEDEWQDVAPLFFEPEDRTENTRLSIRAMKTRRPEDVAAVPVLAKYNELTGFFESNKNAILHHRRALFGPVCDTCGKLVRTPRARFCAECGTITEVGRNDKYFSANKVE